MNVYQIIGLVSFTILFIFSLYGSILYGNPYPLVWFFILALVGVLLARTLFRKEKQLGEKRKPEEIFETDNDVQWNMYIYFVLFILVGYPLLSIPRYFAGTHLKALLAGYAVLIIVFGIFGVLIRIYIWNKKPKLGFTLTSTLILLAIIGAGILSFAISMLAS